MKMKNLFLCFFILCLVNRNYASGEESNVMPTAGNGIAEDEFYDFEKQYLHNPQLFTRFCSLKNIKYSLGNNKCKNLIDNLYAHEFNQEKSYSYKKLEKLKNNLTCPEKDIKGEICSVPYHKFTKQPVKQEVVLPNYFRQYKEAEKHMTKMKEEEPEKLTAHFIVGLSSTGKSTMAQSIVNLISNLGDGRPIYTVDGDDVREGHNVYQEYMQYSRSFQCIKDMPKIVKAGKDRAQRSGKSYIPWGLFKQDGTIKNWPKKQRKNITKLSDINYEYSIRKIVETEVTFPEFKNISQQLKKQFNMELKKVP
jgi:hypothetical protein